MLAAIVRASNRYAMRPALVIDDRTYTYQESQRRHHRHHG